MIAREGNLTQVCCDSCPASYPNTYADEDFAVMIADARTAGWIIRKALPAGGQDTSDLFGRPPKVAGTARPQPYTHTCPACASAGPKPLYAKEARS